MLTPEELLHISEGAEEIAEELHQDILNRIIERIMIRLDRGENYILTAYDKWQLQVLQDAGVLSEDIIKEITEKTKLMEQEIAEAFEDAGVKSYAYDSEVYEAANIFSEPLEQSSHYIRMMQRNYEKTLGEMVNFTGTLANAAQQSFILGCDKAYNLVLSGAVGYSQAVKEVVNDIVKDGVVVHYPSGHTDTIETATLRAVRTGVSQACADVTTARMDEMDWDIILVSAHLGARVTDKEDFTNHYWWQGQFYSKSGKDKRFKPFSVCGYGHVQGIHGANCRHSIGPGDGEFNPYDKFDSEENEKAYEQQQRQRLLERRIRKTKREVMGLQTARDNATDDLTRAELDLEYQRKAALLQKQNKAYNDYCEQNGLKKLRDRIDVARWDRKQAAVARGAAKKRIAAVGEGAATQNWNTIPVTGGQTETKYRMLKEPMDIDENVAATNPGYKKGGAEYRQNCQRCVPTYVMRKRGYDVVAKPAVVDENGILSANDPLYTKWNKVFKDAKFLTCIGNDGGLSDAERLLEEWGDGAVAEVRVAWKSGGSHVFIAERQDGITRFLDPQNGKVDCEIYFTDAVNGVTMIARLDNLKATDLIKECIKNRGGKG